MAASVTVSPGKRDPCHVVPATHPFVSPSPDVGGAQRLAIFAADFAREEHRLEDVSRPRERFREFRVDRRVVRADDEADRRRIAAELEARGVTTRSVALGQPRSLHP